MERDSAAKKKCLLLVDDHALFREILSICLRADSEWDVVSAVSSVTEALTVLRSAAAIDAVLLHFDFGLEQVFHFLRQARSSRLQRPVVVITAGVSPQVERRLLASGASANISTHVSLKELSEGLQEILAGREWPASMTGESASPAVPALITRASLTERQQIVANGILAGKSNKEIAAPLNVTESSVKCTVQQLFAITGVRTRSRLVRILLEICWNESYQ